MGSVVVAKAHSLGRIPAACQLVRWFSLSAASGVVYPQFNHARTHTLAEWPPSLFSSLADSKSFIGSSDFIFRHGYNDGPFAAFKTGRMSGLYRRDPRQEGVILKLQELHERLNGMSASHSMYNGLTMIENMRSSGQVQGKSNWFSGIVKMMQSEMQINGAVAKERSTKVRANGAGATHGLYLYGGVGVGKTMLMDMFVATKPLHIKVRRAHFHNFMLDIHGRLKEQAHKQDPLAFVADSISAEAGVLALDELFVTDVADAMIINRLFKRLWDQQMVLIATSNRKPDDLYLGGLQRDLFLPFIDNLKGKCIIHDMESVVDYRKLARHNKGIYFTGETRNRCLVDAFDQKTIGHSKKRNATISLQMGRKLHIPLSAGAHCYFTFEQLCGQPVGSADYLGICRHFHSIFVQDVPIINASNKPAAYRFVTLIDILYDQRVRVFCSAEGVVHELFHKVISHVESVAKTEGDWVVDDQLSFAKERSISRLTEMESMEYLVDHANRHAPELLLALAEVEEQNQEQTNTL